MVYLILIVLVAIWLHSYFKFCSKMSYFKTMVNMLQRKVAQDPENSDLLIRLASAHMQIQHYKTARELYAMAISKGLPLGTLKSDIEINMEFCSHPVPSVSRAKDYNHDYWHNFFLVRFGSRRKILLEEQDYIECNHISGNH